MTATQSRTLAKPETSDMGLPSVPAKGVMPAAAVRVKLLPTAERRDWRKERKFAVSLAETALQPMPLLLGYSHLPKGRC